MDISRALSNPDIKNRIEKLIIAGILAIGTRPPGRRRDDDEDWSPQKIFSSDFENVHVRNKNIKKNMWLRVVRRGERDFNPIIYAKIRSQSYFQ